MEAGSAFEHHKRLALHVDAIKMQPLNYRTYFLVSVRCLAKRRHHLLFPSAAKAGRFKQRAAFIIITVYCELQRWLALQHVSELLLKHFRHHFDHLCAGPKAFTAELDRSGRSTTRRATLHANRVLTLDDKQNQAIRYAVMIWQHHHPIIHSCNSIFSNGLSIPGCNVHARHPETRITLLFFDQQVLQYFKMYCAQWDGSVVALSQSHCS